MFLSGSSMQNCAHASQARVNLLTSSESILRPFSKRTRVWVNILGMRKAVFHRDRFNRGKILDLSISCSPLWCVRSAVRYTTPNKHKRISTIRCGEKCEKNISFRRYLSWEKTLHYNIAKSCILSRFFIFLFKILYLSWSDIYAVFW